MFDLLLCQHRLMAMRIFTFGAWVAPPSGAILAHAVLGESKLYPLVTLFRPLRLLLSLGMGLVRRQGCDDF